jgi:hypothetical protein
MFSKVMPYRMGQSFACSMFAPANGSTVISTSHQFLAILRWVVFSTAGCVMFHASIISLMVCHFVSDSHEVMTALIVVLPLIVVVEISLQLHRSLHASIICLFQVSQTPGTHNGYLFCYSQKVLCLLRSLRDLDGFFWPELKGRHL